MNGKARPVLHVRGTPVFAEYLSKLDRKSNLYESIDDALTALKRDCMVGIKIQQKLWPKMYIQKYGKEPVQV